MEQHRCTQHPLQGGGFESVCSICGYWIQVTPKFGLQVIKIGDPNARHTDLRGGNPTVSTRYPVAFKFDVTEMWVLPEEEIPSEKAAEIELLLSEVDIPDQW